MTSPPAASIIVITRNRPDDLADCLRSCERQTGGPFELIVVDNQSTDDTLSRVARDFPAAKLVALHENRGVSGGRNAGTDAASSDICVYIDDDAAFANNDAIQRVMGYFQSDPALACIAFTIRDWKTGREETKSIPRRDKKSIATDYEATYFCGAGYALRRPVFLELGGFWAPLVYGSQEIDLSYRLLDRGVRIIKSAVIEVIHKSAPSGRPSGQWVYFNTRDRPWVALRHLPLRCVFTTTILWWLNTVWVALRTQQLGRFFRGIWDSLTGLPAAWRSRQRIGPEAIGALKQLSGRYWY